MKIGKLKNIDMKEPLKESLISALVIFIVTFPFSYAWAIIVQIRFGNVPIILSLIFMYIMITLGCRIGIYIRDKK